MKDESKYKISLSAKAAEQIKLQLQKRGTPQAFLRLGIRGGGCSGYSYIIQYEDNPPTSKDLVFESEGVQLIVDIKSIVYLNNSVLDWDKNLMYQGFKFRNPQEKSSCGCGESFSV